MKKKVLLTLVMALFVVISLVLCVSAESVHAGKVDLNQTVTLNDGKVVNLFDSEGNALIWYVDGKDSEGKNIYGSIRADDPNVVIYSGDYLEVTDLYVLKPDGTKRSDNDIVVVNFMDDDVTVNNSPKAANIGKPFINFKTVFSYWAKLEYAYLRLDTIKVQKESFKACTSLKYVNLEDLTKLERIGDGAQFYGCTSLFKDQILDLSKTKVTKIDGGNTFYQVPLKGIKFPSGLSTMGTGMFQYSGLESVSFPKTVTAVQGSTFQYSAKLKTVCFYENLASIGKNVFNGCTSLEKMFFVGTLEQLNALYPNINTTGNNPLFDLFGENNANVISYTDYLALEDKSGKYVVYGYSYCEGYNDGNHEKNEELSNNCVVTCSVCELVIVKHVDTDKESTVIEYTDLMKSGEKVTACGNEGCTFCINETLKPIFYWVGYSAKTFGELGFGQQYIINEDELATYKAYLQAQGKTFSYGVVAAGASSNGNPLSVVNGAVAAKAGAEFITFDNVSYDAFFMNITGMGEGDLDVSLVCCAYVQLGNEIVYLDNNETVSAVTLKSYNQIDAIVNPKEEL